MISEAFGLYVFWLVCLVGWETCITKPYAAWLDRRADMLWEELHWKVPDTSVLGILDEVCHKYDDDTVAWYVCWPIAGAIGIAVIEFDFYLDAERLRSLCKPS